MPLEPININTIPLPPDADRDKEKAYAYLCRLHEKLRLQHNEEGSVFVGTDKWIGFQRDLESRIKPVGWKRSRVGKTLYPLVDVIAGDTSRNIAHENKINSQTDIKLDANLSGHPLLKIPDDFVKITPSDPLENYETFDEIDPNSKISKVSDTITVTGLINNVDAYVRKDMGADHFPAAGDFEHLFKHTATAATVGVNGLFTHAVATTAVSQVHTAPAYSIYTLLWASPSGGVTTYFTCRENGVLISSDNTILGIPEGGGQPWTTPNWLKCVKDGMASTGDLFIYSDEPRTVLLDHLSITGVDQTYRYLFAACSCNNGAARTISGLIEDLDLQEPSTGRPNYNIPFWS